MTESNTLTETVTIADGHEDRLKTESRVLIVVGHDALTMAGEAAAGNLIVAALPSPEKWCTASGAPDPALRSLISRERKTHVVIAFEDRETNADTWRAA